MAEAQQSLLKNSSSIQTIQGSLNSFGKSLRMANSTSSSIIKSLYKGNRDKKSAIAKQRELFQIRRDSVRKRDREDIIEAGKITSLSSGYKKASNTIANSTKGFFGRALDFAGTVMVGWLIGNLPTIIKMTQNLIERIQKLINILSSWTDSVSNFLNGFTSQVNAILSNILGIDFKKEKESVDDGIGKTETGIKKVLLDVENMISKLIGFDLLKALGLKESDLDSTQPSGKDAPSSGTRGTSGRLLPIHREALDIIAGPESGGNYNAMNQGTDKDGNILGSGDSSKIIGKPLTSMTIGEVMDRQDERKYPRGAKPDRGIHAAGKYQIIGSTMKEALRLSGLSKSDMFSPENQDLLGIAVLQSQGPGAWSKYSSYTKEQIAIMYKAKNTPLGQAAPSIDKSVTFKKGQDVSSIVGAPAKISSRKGDFESFRSREHGGIDIACNPGLYISLRGVDAEVVGTQSGGGYGNCIDIWIPSLGIQLRFAHNTRILISSGKIPAGTSFATTGYTGNVRPKGPDGSHIHLEADTRRGNKRYGGNTSPNPYVALIRLTDARIEGVASENIPGMSGQGGPSLERIPKQTGVDKKVTPEKGAKTIPIPMPMGGGAQQSAPAPQGGGGGGDSISMGGGDQLNTFVIKTLLRELEYV